MNVSRMFPLVLTAFLHVGLTFGAAFTAEAQWLPEPSASPGVSPPSVDRAFGASIQERRLPVLDEAGEPISYREIEALVDPSGTKGAAWGLVAGVLTGLVIGGIASRCGGVRGGYRYYCSPREESLKTVLPAGLAFTLGFSLGWAGWNQDRVTFDEAVKRIRRQRALGR